MRFKDEYKLLGLRTQKWEVAMTFIETQWGDHFYKEDQEFGLGHVQLRLLLSNPMKRVGWQLESKVCSSKEISGSRR